MALACGGMTLVRLRADRWAAGGEAIARGGDGRVVFVGGALPGELVDVEITDERRDWARGRVRVVVEPSPSRVEPPCAARRAGCGGCGWMHVEPTAQMDAKVAVVTDALARLGRRGDMPVGVAGAVAATGYRTTMRVCGDTRGRAGLRGEHSHDLVAVDDCLVAHPPLRELLGRLHIRPGVEVIVRYSVAEQRFGLMWEGADDAVSGFPADAVLGPRGVLHETVAGRSLQVSMASFFQSGPEAAGLLVAGVRRLLPELDAADTLVDAYSGVGLFAACAAPDVPRVFAIETGRTAVADAVANLCADPAPDAPGDDESRVGGGARRGADRRSDHPESSEPGGSRRRGAGHEPHVHESRGRGGARRQADDGAGAAQDPATMRDVTVVRGEVGGWRAPPGTAIDVVIADPARSGLGKPGTAALARLGAPVIGLVSCDPASLGRDVKLLAEHGYELTACDVVDVFPQTTHVETLARFERRAG